MPIDLDIFQQCYSELYCYNQEDLVVFIDADLRWQKSVEPVLL